MLFLIPILLEAGSLAFSAYRVYRAARAIQAGVRVASAVNKGQKAVKTAKKLENAAKASKKLKKAKKSEVCTPCERAKAAKIAQTKKAKYKPKVDKRYNRPTGFRKGVRDQVFNNSKRSDGKVRDPGNGKVIRRNEKWDMGHKPGYEFRKHQQSAKERSISRKQFLDEHNNPNHYRPETPRTNRSRMLEDKSKKYKGL